jgi:sporulation protein YlmC with PRC-barrel domain
MIRASDIIGARVLTESGDRLGRVHDLRAHGVGGEWRLMGLVVGAGGLAARLGGGAGADEPIRAGRVIPWEAIARLEDGSITVRDEVAALPDTG